MPRRRPEYTRGCYYHIYNRGALRQPIFRLSKDFLLVVRRMKQVSRSLSLTVIAYCLSPNHYHWLGRQDGDQRAGLLPQRVFNSYVKVFNARNERSGTLFEGPYRVIPIESESHLVQLCRYIHLNPVCQGLVPHPEAWPYGNYREWVGRRSGTLFERQFVADWFEGPAQYAALVRESLSEKPWDTAAMMDPGPF